MCRLAGHRRPLAEGAPLGVVSLAFARGDLPFMRPRLERSERVKAQREARGLAQAEAKDGGQDDWAKAQAQDTSIKVSRYGPA